MIFEAYIPYTFMQSREAKKFNDERITGDYFQFTFCDLLGSYSKLDDKDIFITPTFTVREIIVPWLRYGNLPGLLK